MQSHTMDEGVNDPGRPPRRRAFVFAVSAAAALVVGVFVYRANRKSGGGDPLGPDQYRAAVSAFYAGVAAMNVDDIERAKVKLARAIELAPREPAAWADLGLLHLRLGDFESAAKELGTAQKLAPRSGQVEMLLGLLADKRGDFAASAAHFRRAVELDPAHLRARFALVTAVERQGGAESAAEVRKQVDELLKLQPDNLVVLLDGVRSAVRRGDAPAAGELVGRVEKLSGNWPADVKARLAALRQAVSAPDVRPAATQVAFLRNVLLQLPEFREDIAAVQSPPDRVGEPIERLLALPSPRPTPAPPDEGLTFAITPVRVGDGVAAGGWPTVTPAWLGAEGVPALLVANGSEVRRVSGGDGAPADPVAMAFPGGPSAVPPSPDGVLAVDWANNFQSGLVLAGAGGVRLMGRGSDGKFVDVTGAALGGDPIGRADAYGAWAADVDLEGDLDVVVGLRDGPPAVLRNNSDGTFAVIRPFKGVANLRGFAWADLDGDGDPDASLLEAGGKLTVLSNERAGRFVARAVPEAVGEVAALSVADVDRDGVFDLLALGGDGRVQRLSDRRGGAEWEVATLAGAGAPVAEGAAREAPPVARLLAADVDNNGAIDLIASGPGGAQVWLGGADGRFSKMSATVGAKLLGAAQLSGSGELELLGVDGTGGPVRVSPRGKKGYHWQAVRPRAKALTGDGRINSFGIGGEMEVRAGLLWQKVLIQSGSVHFGLGENPQADVVRIVWPNGSVQAEFDLKADQEVAAEQRLKGSCPMLFAHDGKGVQFITDLIWRSPLGLRINAQDTAAAMQTEDWVRVRGDQLAPLDGYYDLRVTAELWETHYFDHLSLMVVDHPEGTEVFVDERFAVPQPPLKAFLTTPPTPVKRATDHHGTDVTGRVAARDGKYPDAIGRGRYQGITGEHWLELDLGAESSENEPGALVGFGWVHPTDSSINVAISQGRHAPPRGLSIEVPDGKGGWRVAREGLGFPAGKNKTVVIGLEGLWEPGAPRRLRLRSNLEVYWDWLAYAVLLEDAGKMRVQRLPAHAADLRYRGFSAIEAADPHSPELPEYDRMMGTAPRWRDLVGYYTRFGDVRELLETVDDRYVIMNAGDEMRLRFAAPPAPGNGVKRDFVVVADGWEKDGDYNTAFSKTVLPLPRHDWPAYDKEPGRLEDDPVYRRYPEDWVRFHRRYVGPEDFRDALRPRE